MKKLSTFFYFLVLFLPFVACSTDEEDLLASSPVNPAELKISAATPEIVANGIDESELRLFYMGKEVTADAKFFANGEELSENSFTATEVGSYEFTAVYKGVRAVPIQIQAVEASPDEVVLTAVNKLIAADGAEQVLFRVRKAGQDVTSESAIYVNGEYVKDGKFTTRTPGIYQVKAVYAGVESNEQTISVRFMELALTSDVTEIGATGADFARLTVTYGGKDVTDQSTIYVNGEPIVGNTFSSKVEGDFEVHAVYHKVMYSLMGADYENLRLAAQAADQGNAPAKLRGNRPSVGGYDNFYANVPREFTNDITSSTVKISAKVSFENFRRRCLFNQFTATWCGYCPQVITSIHYFCENDENADDAVFAAAHSRDTFTSDFGNTLISYMGISGYPSFKINFTNDVPVNSDPKSGARTIRNMLNEHLKTPAHSGISATVSDVDADGKVTVDANIRIGVKGYYRVAAWVLEDNLYGAQNDYYNYAEDLTNHNNVVRGSSSTSAQGDLIAVKQLEAKSTHNYNRTLNLKSMGVADYNNCRILVVVTTNQTSNLFSVDNVISCRLGESRDYEYKAK